jgi:glucosamine--fructose-6-phosphate aminotransferase (isomerizing)
MSQISDRTRCETFRRDVEEVPAALQRVLTAYSRPAGPLAALASLRRLPAARFVLTGMGSSLNACMCAAWWFRQAGIAAWAEYASDIELAPLDGGWTMVAVSQSGRTPEVLRAVRNFRSSGGGGIIGVTNRDSSPLAAEADVCLPLLAGPEGDVAAKSYAASVAVLTLLVGRVLGDPPGFRAADLASAADAGFGVLTDWPALEEPFCTALTSARTAVVMGSQAGRAAAEEGALVLKEASRVPVEGFVTAEFLHGALYLAGPGLTAVLLPAATGGWPDREARRWVLDRGSTLIEIGGHGPATLQFPLASLTLQARPLAEALPMELAASTIWQRSLDAAAGGAPTHGHARGVQGGSP